MTEHREPETRFERVAAGLSARMEGVLLPIGTTVLASHAPLVIAEQFGTLEALHPDRIDLGIGRAPGTDQVTVLASGGSGERTDIDTDSNRKIADVPVGSLPWGVAIR